MAEHRARRALAPVLAIALVAAVLALVPTSPAEAETQLKWLVTRDDVGLVDGNDASGEGEPVKVDGAGHPLLIGQAYDPDEPTYGMRFGGGKIVARSTPPTGRWLRAAPGDPGAAGPDPLSPDPGRHALGRDPAAGEGPAGRRDQAHVGGIEGALDVGPQHDRGAHRRSARQRCARRDGDRQDAQQARRPRRGAQRALRSHHVVAARQILDHVDFIDAGLATLSQQIAERTEPFAPVFTLLSPVPASAGCPSRSSSPRPAPT